ncbi:hypothetical protein PoHVEF18_004131 [Penicillium ochrochloron]
MQASQWVLAIPEMLALILQFTAADNLPEAPERQKSVTSDPSTRLPSSDSRVTLYSCAQVNHR